jgi:tetratricopeptide (TPR) repeat protein
MAFMHILRRTVDIFEKLNFLAKLPIYFLFFLSLLFCFQPVSANESAPFPGKYITPELDRTILAAETLVMERRYEEARDLFNGLEKKDQRSLLPSMGRLLILMARSFEKGESAGNLEKSFQVEFEKNRKILKKKKKSKNLNGWDHFLIGGSLGVRGLYELEQQDYFSAFMHGLSALSHFGEAQRQDPLIFDVYFSSGLYKYFRSVKTRYLWFLPLIRDQREEGLEEIRLALNKGYYAVPACKIALVFLAEKEGKDVEGIRMGEAFLEEYPDCLLIRDSLAEIYRRQDRHLDAARTYRDGYKGDVSIRWVLLQAGREFLKADALVQAEESLQEYLATSPLPSGAAQAHLGLARIYLRQGEHSRSHRERERAVLLDPSLKDIAIQE